LPVTTGNALNAEAQPLKSIAIAVGAFPLAQLCNLIDDMRESWGLMIGTSLINTLYSYTSIGLRLLPVLDFLPTKDLL
jgi:hypothetical protein